MNPRILLSMAVAAIAAALPMAGGCGPARELKQVKQDIARQLPDADFEHELSFAIGPGGMALTRAITSFVPDTDDVHRYLEDVTRVEVAVYEIHTDKPSRRIETPSRIEEMLANGWELAARVREKHESAWVLYRIEGDSVRELFVVALDKEELVLVKVKGRLERVIGRALTQGRLPSHHSSIDTRVPASARTARS